MNNSMKIIQEIIDQQVINMKKNGCCDRQSDHLLLLLKSLEIMHKVSSVYKIENLEYIPNYYPTILSNE